MARGHDLKTQPKSFEAVVFGEKKAELRRNDRDFRVGDILILREWDPETQEYTGRGTQVDLLHVLDAAASFGALRGGYVMLSLGAVPGVWTE
jgi:hypothetical protein